MPVERVGAQRRQTAARLPRRGAQHQRRQENKWNKAMNRDPTSASVPGMDKQAEADLWQRYGAKHGVWTEAMLIAPGRGKEGNKWFTLIDSRSAAETAGVAI